MPYYDLGDNIPITVTVRDADGTAVAPSTATLTIELPDGTTISPSVTPAIPVAYDYPSTMAGRHTYRIVTTGPSSAFGPDVFNVRPSTGGGIIGIADAREQLNFDAATNDEEVRSLIASATRIIEDYRGEVIVRRTVVDQRATYSSGTLWLNHSPVISLTTIASDTGGSWLPGDFLLDGGMGAARLASGCLSGIVTVTYVAGYQVVPDHYISAAMKIVQHLWMDQRGSRGGPRFAGMDSPGDGVSPYGSPLPTLVRELLGPRPPMVA